MRHLVDLGVAVPDLGESGGHRRDREILGPDLGELLPVEWRRDGRARLGPDAVGRRDRPVARVLVVVDEDPLAALLLPPARRDLIGEASLELPAEGDRRVADVGKRPPRFDPDVDVNAAPAGGLREAAVAEFLKQLARPGGDERGVFEVGARLGVEVEAELVGMVDVLAPHRPGMEGDRAHLAGPGDHRDLGGADLVGAAARGEGDLRRLHVFGSALRHTLLVEGVAHPALARRQDHARVHALGPALERGRAAVQRAHDPGVDGQVVVDDVELRDWRGAGSLGEDHTIGVRHAHIAPPGVDDRGGQRGHDWKFYRSGDLGRGLCDSLGGARTLY